MIILNLLLCIWGFSLMPLSQKPPFSLGVFHGQVWLVIKYLEFNDCTDGNSVAIIHNHSTICSCEYRLFSWVCVCLVIILMISYDNYSSSINSIWYEQRWTQICLIHIDEDELIDIYVHFNFSITVTINHHKILDMGMG